MQSNSTEAIATPPSSVASPSRPIAVVETMPISGVVRFAIIAGPAMANTCAVVTFEGGAGECMLDLAGHAVMAAADKSQLHRLLPPVSDYRPRGLPNSRDSSQIGITITAPSRK